MGEKNKNETVRNTVSNEAKLAKLKKVLPVLLLAPYTKILFLAGSVAAGLARPDSDIDLIVVAQNNRVWLNKFFLEILTRIFKIKRTKNNNKNKICFNIFLGSIQPLLPHRDIVGAGCYKNLKPVWGTPEEIKKFWGTNSWISNFCEYEPSQKKIFSEPKKINLAPKKLLEFFLTFTGLSFILEKIFYKTQVSYLKNKLNQSVSNQDAVDYDFFVAPNLVAYHFPVSNYARIKRLVEAAVENRPKNPDQKELTSS
ncbi:MAG: nucleotidyltransferase domain-containing protein [Patescibacteria group bacterium]